MKEFNINQPIIESVSAVQTILDDPNSQHALYVGLDVHKETIAVAIANPCTTVKLPTHQNTSTS
jgi:hypothetical protein